MLRHRETDALRRSDYSQHGGDTELTLIARQQQALDQRRALRFNPRQLGSESTLVGDHERWLQERRVLAHQTHDIEALRQGSADMLAGASHNPRPA